MSDAPRVSDARLATLRPWQGEHICHQGCAADGIDLVEDLRDARIKLEALAARSQRLEIALDESVKLQSHQARMLNMYDGGERREFADGAAWMARLEECGRFE